MGYADAAARAATVEHRRFGEIADYTPASGAYTTRLSTAIFGEIQKDQQVSTGFWGDVQEISILASELVDPTSTEVAPATGDTLTRYPDTLAPVDKRENWLVHLVDMPDEHRWTLTCVKAPRVTPGG